MTEMDGACGASLSARCFNGEAGCRVHPVPGRPWCGAAAELGGQQPCPIERPCVPGFCAIGAAAVEPEPWHPYEQSDPAVNGCDHCGEDRRLHP